ncbi:haloacid dehalogenase-like hydrolase [Neobacillus sp. YX16]|uniref:DUF7916 family protein n=1 Tax=Neobacillus sp. YX16 TaxID=3047874 RepID=UPI0024C233E5|nr:haloacid dehalogenase-like hydrolase [Neobacillus sp. YX16]WHZ05826.1 haloacid dehalogenase-like hydrolase [Neobacillus sp. YX16]
MKRILDCRGSDFRQMGREELKQAIRAAEGRTIMAETVVTSQPLLPEVSNPEVMKAFGADMILLNMFDCFKPVVNGVESYSIFQSNAAGSVDEKIIQKIKELTGLPVGINLEPVDPHANSLEKLYSLPEGRTATENSLAMAKQLGCDFICLTGNPKSGVTNEKIEQAITLANKHFGGLIIAGKMHNAGTAGSVFDLDAFSRFADAGADVILFPAPGTVPGVREETLANAIENVKNKGALTLAAIGTSQEGADEETIRAIALSSKRAGVDIFHIGDAGYSGMALPENIQTLSITVRGKRHTYIRMAASALR